MTVDQISEVRAMLALFSRSDWSDLHLRTSSIELFIARPGGAANPIATARADAVEVRAPHVATLHWLAGVGAEFAIGEAVATLDLLGEKVEVPATSEGRVIIHRSRSGDLVEYGQILLTMAP